MSDRFLPWQQSCYNPDVKESGEQLIINRATEDRKTKSWIFYFPLNQMVNSDWWTSVKTIE